MAKKKKLYQVYPNFAVVVEATSKEEAEELVCGIMDKMKEVYDFDYDFGDGAELAE